jgi:hypothetical protein
VEGHQIEGGPVLRKEAMGMGVVVVVVVVDMICRHVCDGQCSEVVGLSFTWNKNQAQGTSYYFYYGTCQKLRE